MNTKMSKGIWMTVLAAAALAVPATPVSASLFDQADHNQTCYTNDSPPVLTNKVEVGTNYLFCVHGGIDWCAGLVCVIGTDFFVSQPTGVTPAAFVMSAVILYACDANIRPNSQSAGSNDNGECVDLQGSNDFNSQVCFDEPAGDPIPSLCTLLATCTGSTAYPATGPNGNIWIDGYYESSVPFIGGNSNLAFLPDIAPYWASEFLQIGIPSPIVQLTETIRVHGSCPTGTVAIAGSTETGCNPADPAHPNPFVWPYRTPCNTPVTGPFDGLIDGVNYKALEP